MLASPAIDKQERLAALETVFRGRIPDILMALLRMMVSRGHVGALGDMFRIYREMIRESQGEVIAQVFSAVPLSGTELNSLRERAGEDTRVLSADFGGIFSTLVDGYETLSPAALSELSPSRLTELLEQDPSIPAGAYGKLVSSYRWYFAAAMSAEDAENLQVGRAATLNFGRYYGTDIRAVVVSVSAPENGSSAVVFRCDTSLSDTLGMRRVSADVIFAEYSGIRVPSQALQTDPETGEEYVWCISATILERKNVSVLYRDVDFAIIDRSATAAALREGNVVVVSGEDLYEGKVMG